ncbi:hypothetical protein [Endozoicomonas acroporae]|uniref:hypothetical protein n=1 Tax=Endozoicomonas acroporae TaxID=1701104 RepID=UPI0013D4A7D6|nr:hypothetical protein [Endozoicomonas acroporae]
MKLIHTSPEEIKTIHAHGLFDDCLFFSSSEYTMTQSDTVFVYSLEQDDEQVVAVYELYDEEIVSEIAEKLEISEDDAERVLDGRDSSWNHGGDGEDDWWVQAKQGECAKKMGYQACESKDEQGTVYIIPMFGREADLNLERIDAA